MLSAPTTAMVSWSVQFWRTEMGIDVAMVYSLSVELMESTNLKWDNIFQICTGHWKNRNIIDNRIMAGGLTCICFKRNIQAITNSWEAFRNLCQRT